MKTKNKIALGRLKELIGTQFIVSTTHNNYKKYVITKIRQERTDMYYRFLIREQKLPDSELLVYLLKDHPISILSATHAIILKNNIDIVELLGCRGR